MEFQGFKCNVLNGREIVLLGFPAPRREMKKTIPSSVLE